MAHTAHQKHKQVKSQVHGRKGILPLTTPLIGHICIIFFCGEVEDVVGALTTVVGGVAQVFRDLLVELRLLLVAEEEEEEEEDRQEESWEGESGVGRVQRDNAHMDDMWMRCGQGSNLSQM